MLSKFSLNRNKIRFCSKNNLNLKLIIAHRRRLHFCFSKNSTTLFIVDDDDNDDDDGHYDDQNDTMFN